jgi:transposase
MAQLPAYAPDFNPLEPLWKKVKKALTHLKHCPAFTD